MYKEIINKIKPELEKNIKFLEDELTKMHVNQASPSLVENIIIDYAGQKFSLKQLAAISCPGARQIIIQPWDKSYIEAIEKGILRSKLDLNPIVDKDLIRLSLPCLSEEYRKNLEILLSEKIEEARKTVRHWREEAWKEIQVKFREGKIREDDKFRGKDELQDLIDENNEKIKEIGERKRKEIME